MKKTLLILLLSLYHIFVFAQIPLETLYKDGTTFNGLKKIGYDSHNPPNHNYTYSTRGYEIKINGDTIISGITYHKLHLRDLGGFQYSQYYPNTTYSYASSTSTYIARLRVDNSKLFITMDCAYCYNVGQEFVRYDFGKNLGDSTYGLAITAIDSIQLNTGDYVKRFSFAPYNTTWYAEGLGSPDGLLPDYLFHTGWRPDLINEIAICYNSGAIDYHFTYDKGKWNWKLMDNCFDMNALSVEETIKQKQLTLYPNPSNGSFTVEGSVQSTEANLTLYNTFGQVVYTAKELVSNNYINRKIDLQDLPKGVYRLVLQADTHMQTLPLVVE
jgi:hypothetical protein